MTVEVGNIVLILTLIVMFSGIIAALFKLFYRFKCLEAQAAHRKEDTEIMLLALLAILDGLKEQGCNGPVTDARERLRKYLVDNR